MIYVYSVHIYSNTGKRALKGGVPLRSPACNFSPGQGLLPFFTDHCRQDGCGPGQARSFLTMKTGNVRCEMRLVLQSPCALATRKTSHVGEYIRKYRFMCVYGHICVHLFFVHF